MKLKILFLLERGRYELIAAVDYFRTWVVAVDLSDLGKASSKSSLDLLESLPIQRREKGTVG